MAAPWGRQCCAASAPAAARPGAITPRHQHPAYAFRGVGEKKLEDPLAAWARANAPTARSRGCYDHARVRDATPWQQLSAVGIVSGLVVGRYGFAGAKEDAEGAVLCASLNPGLHTGHCVIADAFHTTLAMARYIGENSPRYLLIVKGNQPTIQACVFRRT